MSPDDERRAPDRRMAIAAFIAAFCIAAAVGFTTGRFRTPPQGQPIAFNHRKHVVENEIGCSTCHVFYENEMFSGLPDAEICATCHDQPQGKSAEEARLVSFLRASRPLEWNSLFRQPSHIIFSHRLHVVKAQLECEGCHGDIARTTSPPRSVKKLTMTDCIACHERGGVSVDCNTCHR
ncbi:MAG: cytochrome c3 family protein [Thermoanaerobaculia bacterium]